MRAFGDCVKQKIELTQPGMALADEGKKVDKTRGSQTLFCTLTHVYGFRGVI
jgi:hypothetical protein